MTFHLWSVKSIELLAKKGDNAVICYFPAQNYQIINV